MKSGRVEPELHALRKAAEELARKHREPVTSVHLLAAIAASGAPGAALLTERGLAPDQVLRLGHGLAESLSDATRGLSRRAHDLAVRMGQERASAAHLLVALLNETRSAARRAIELAGVDAGRLRTAALQVALGVVRHRRLPGGASEPPMRRLPSEPSRAATSEPGRPPEKKWEAPRRLSRAVRVPLVPKIPPRPRAPAVPPAAPARPLAAAPPAVAAVSPAKEETAPNEPTATAQDAARPTESGSGRVSVPAKAPARNPSSRFELDAQKFPTLSGLGTNLTLAAARGELDPVVVRESTIERALDVLAKREGNNPCLVGPPGVGKTSVVRGLAQRIAMAREVASLDDRIVIEVRIGELLQGTGVRGALSGRLSALRREVQAAGGRVVLFFDEIHQLFSDGTDEIASELKLMLARGELPCIGATTLEEFQKAIGNDAALARRFTLVDVEEPTREEAYLVLEALRPKLEAHHKLRYSEAALARSVAWSVRYLPGRALPDKAVSILDLAGARQRRRGLSAVEVEAVAEVVAELADMPVERLLESDGERLLKLESILAERVVGHSAQITRIARILRRNAAGLGARRPIGTFLLLGPTGVGKTETAKAIAEVLFQSESAMTRIDLSEYGEAHAVARLIGAPPGYVGHEAGGQLTEAVRRRPYQVVLLDELEKAHPEVLTTFLGVFDEGRLTDGRGRTIDFTNTVILLTSNLGAAEVGTTRRRVGFGDTAAPTQDVEARLVAAARAALPPELYNRIDEVLVYGPLERSEVREIARRLLAGLARALERERGVRLEVAPEVIDSLLDGGGFEPLLGARPMKRAIARLIEAPLAERILRGDIQRGSVVLLEVEDGGIEIDVLEASDLTPPCAGAAE